MRDTTEIERAVAGCILSAPERCVTEAMEAGLLPDWFADDTWRVMWIGVQRLWESGRSSATDAISIWNEARRFAETSDCKKNFAPRVDFAAYETAIDAAPAISHLGYHLSELRLAHIEREVRRAGARFTKAMNAGGDAVHEATVLQSDIAAILANMANTKKISLARICKGIMEGYELAHQKRIVEKDLAWSPGLKFPWSPMTSMLNGLEHGLGIIAARPSVGKTLFALNLIRFWCDHGIHVCFDSLDMSESNLVRRFIAEFSRVSIKKARFSPTQVDLQAMREAISMLEKWPLDYVEIRDVDEFCSHVEIERAAGRAQIVVVDYLGLMHSAKIDNAREYDRVSYVSDTLKALANRCRVPVIALAQLNRDVVKSEDGRMPGLSDLRGSGSIEQDAFWVAFLHRDERVLAGWKAKPPLQLMPDNAKYAGAIDALDAVHFVLAKSQNGECGNLPFLFRKSYLSCSLADFRAQPTTCTVGYGATQKEIKDNSPRFAKVCTDWRHDPLEATLRRQNALIDLPEVVMVDEQAAAPQQSALNLSTAPSAAAPSAAPSARAPCSDPFAEKDYSGYDRDDDPEGM